MRRKSGWNGQTKRHSNAKKYGHAGGKYATAKPPKRFKKVVMGYDVNDPFDKEMALDVPFSQLNAEGRKEKKKKLENDKILKEYQVIYDNVPEFEKARKEYLILKAIDDTNNEIDQKAKEIVLKKGNYKIEDRWKKQNERFPDYKEPIDIKNPNRDYLMSKKDFNKYISEVAVERKKLGLDIPKDFTADYKSRPALNKAEKRFVDSSLNILPDKLKKDLSKVKDQKGLKTYNKFIDINLKLDTSTIKPLKQEYKD